MKELRKKRSLVLWLFSGAFLVFIMVIVGGITRLTHSGLSMVEWNLVMGSLPPMSRSDWQSAFAKYQQFPEYNLINYHFTLDDFKVIFWWEYIHRLLGRLLGIVFIVPFLFFLIKKCFTPQLLRNCMVIFLLGGLQGFLGWYMVKSGLVDNPHVSHYRLAAHLVTASILFGYILWVALGLLQGDSNPTVERSGKVKRISLLLTGMVMLQIVYGAFMAGLKAGFVFNTFPKMGDEWIPPGMTSMEPLWKNFTEGLACVQFCHRYIAVGIALVTGWLWAASVKLNLNSRQRLSLRFTALIVILQFTLGVFTLVYVVPLPLAVMHQAGALILFGSAVHLNRQFQ